MRNLWLVARREYLQRVRTRAFLISTLTMPLFMAALFVLPSALATRSSGTRTLAVVVSSPELGSAIRQQVEGRRPGSEYAVQLHAPGGGGQGEELEALLARLERRELWGILWATEEAVAERKLPFYTREASDFLGRAVLERAVSAALTRHRIAQRGIPGAEVEELFQPVSLETQSTAASGGGAGFLAALVLMMVLYFALTVYGMAVMRSVLEEKTSRIMEVLLGSATPTELMSGKLLGVGAVGMTQLGIWMAAAAVFLLPGVVAGQELVGELRLSWTMAVTFPLFFVGGYLLYSAIFAALGAAVNSEEEAQQLQFFAMLPLIASVVFMFYVVRNPEAPLSVALSLFPLTAPLLMYLRIAAQTPPLWQIAASLALLAAAAYAVLVACARIYRVGILMYGKRPTLAELLNWLRYA